LLKTSGGILYVRPAGSHDDVYLANRQLAAGTRHWDADSQETTVLVSGAGIDALNILTKQRVPLLSDAEADELSAASYSPDDRWVLFLGANKPPAQLAHRHLCGPGAWRRVAPVTDGAGAVRQTALFRPAAG